MTDSVLFRACLKTCTIEKQDGILTTKEGDTRWSINNSSRLVGGGVNDDYLITDNWNEAHIFLESRVQMKLEQTRKTLAELVDKQTKIDILFKERLRDKVQGIA